MTSNLKDSKYAALKCPVGHVNTYSSSKERNTQSGLSSLELDEDLVPRDGLADLDLDGLDHTTRHSAKGVLHLHSLDDAHLLARSNLQNANRL